MTDAPDDERLDADDADLADRLSEERPTPSVALRRRVRFRIGAAAERESLRYRAVFLTGGGTLLVIVGIVLALSGPR